MPQIHYERMIRGDYTHFEEARATASGAWASVYDALYAAASSARPATLPEPVCGEGWLSARQFGLFSASAFDAKGLAYVAELAGSGASADAVRQLARMWQCVWAGQPVETGLPDLSELGAHDPGVPIEYTSLCALAALHAGRKDEALTLARRASRMAASEGVLQMEYLANLVLARVRRRLGDSHLAVRILVALRRVVPPMWERWVNLELFLAGGRTNPIAPPVCPVVDGELRCLSSMLGEDPVEAAAHSWCAGVANESPYGIAGPTLDPNFVAALVVSPGVPARRVLYAGLPEGVSLVAVAPKARRLRLSICHLVAQSAGPSSDELFQQVYGFAREDAGHDELLRGLIHRVRKALKGVAEVVRDGAQLRVVCQHAFAVPDARCERSLGDRVLTYLSAMDGRASAKQIAQGLGIPLRSVQRTLGSLVDEGACETHPDGRRTEYVLEDTTFADPTLHRLRGNA